MFKFDTNIICSQDPSATPERVAQYKEYYKIKYDICKKINPKIIAEIGVRAGYSAWTFLQAAPKATYYGFDANNGTHGGQGGEAGAFKQWAENILQEYDVHLNDIDTQKAQTLSISNVDLFHVDGDHTYSGVQHDLDLASQCISNSGVILVDDIDYIADVKNGVIAWLKQHQEFTHEYIHSLRGEVLITKK